MACMERVLLSSYVARRTLAHDFGASVLQIDAVLAGVVPSLLCCVQKNTNRSLNNLRQSTRVLQERVRAGLSSC